MANHPVLVTIGASTGGPGALATILKGVSKPLNCCIIIVQHIFPNGICSLAHWLSQESGVQVTVAKAGDVVTNGMIYLADGHGHLRISSLGTLQYFQEPELVHMPSIDILFSSVAAEWKGDAVGVLLTGMGADGAQGLSLLRGKNFVTIAQDEATCVVYGMPKAAVKLNAAQLVLPLSEISHHIEQCVAGYNPNKPETFSLKRLARAASKKSSTSVGR